jgi:hypothetical protein
MTVAASLFFGMKANQMWTNRAHCEQRLIGRCALARRLAVVTSSQTASTRHGDCNEVRPQRALESQAPAALHRRPAIPPAGRPM